MLGADAQQMFFERFGQALRQHGHALPLALRLTNRQLPMRELDIFDAQPRALHHAQACTVEQTGHEPVNTCELGENPRDLRPREDDWQMLWPACALDLFKLR